MPWSRGIAAGTSAESGVRTFRDAGGLWEEHRLEEVATPEGFDRDPLRVWRFYAERRRQASDISWSMLASVITSVCNVCRTNSTVTGCKPKSSA